MGLHQPKIWTEADKDGVRSGRRLGLELPKIVTGADQDWDYRAAQDGTGNTNTKIGTGMAKD